MRPCDEQLTGNGYVSSDGYMLNVRGVDAINH